jgi:probable phosphomutase (TIGR03848 family)
VSTGATTFLLIRHGAHLLGGETIAGRAPGVNLSPLGREQVGAMAERVAKVPVAAIYSSPVDRTRQTADVLASRLGLPVRVSEALSEIDFGEWTGTKLEQLRGREPWKQWNAFRSGSAAPAGERMLAVQTRIVTEMLSLRERHPDEIVALVSHGDVIKAAVAYWLGVPLDLFQRIEISLASVTVVRLRDYGPWVLSVNGTGEIVLG